jgi:predicted neuraminidase
MDVTRRFLGVGAGAVLVSPSIAAASVGSSDAILSSGFIYEDAPYPQAHASTVVQTTEDVIAAAWFGGTHEKHPDVCIWFARLDGDHWGYPIQVTDGVQPDGTRHPTWNPVLFQPPGGPLILFYKVGPDPFSWWGMVVESQDGGRSWSAPRRLPDGVLGPIKNKPVVLSDGSWISPSSTEAGEGMGNHAGSNWRLHFEISRDRGRTWSLTSPVASPLNIDAIQPSLLSHGDVLQAVARTRQGALASTWSRDGGQTWSPLGSIDLPNPNSGTDAVTLKDGRHLVIYNHSAHSPDTPGKGPRWPLNLALSDDGVVWRNVLTLATKPVPAGYAYPAIIQAADGRVHATWTHDRRRISHVVIDPSKLE